MIFKNHISILHKPKVKPSIDYCLRFTGNGYIKIDALRQFFDHTRDFYFEMQFKVGILPPVGFDYLMNSCYNATNNKVGIAISKSNLYVQIDKGSEIITEIYTSFSDTTNWHTIKVTYDRGNLSSILDSKSLTTNIIPSLILPSTVGCKIASDTASSNGLSGRVDNILLTDLSNPLAQYPLNTGSGSTAYDSVGSSNGQITNGSWRVHG